MYYLQYHAIFSVRQRNAQLVSTTPLTSQHDNHVVNASVALTSQDKQTTIFWEAQTDIFLVALWICNTYVDMVSNLEYYIMSRVKFPAITLYTQFCWYIRVYYYKCISCACTFCACVYMLRACLRVTCIEQGTAARVRIQNFNCGGKV